jgi:microcystin-dependent protein
MSIAQNTALFSLLGTTYGGDGVTTFGLPNLQSRMPMHFGTGPGLSTRALGQVGGEENVTLTATQMPAHAHPIPPTAGGASSGPANATTPIGNFPAPATDSNGGDITAYSTTATGSTGLGSGGNTGVAGGSTPHDNMPPYLCVNFIIALVGIFPSRN